MTIMKCACKFKIFTMKTPKVMHQQNRIVWQIYTEKDLNSIYLPSANIIKQFLRKSDIWKTVNKPDNDWITMTRPWSNS